VKFAATASAFRPHIHPATINPNRAKVFAIVNTFCTIAPVRTPSVFTHVKNTTTPIPVNCSVCKNGRILFPGEIHGTNTPANFANATPTAAIVPVCITRKKVHPNKNPYSGPNASRKYTYCPPARGIAAASSP
jgi:hypothetical protein